MRHALRPLLLFAVLLVTDGVTAQPIGDAANSTSSNWSSPFPALNGDVVALAVRGDTLYAGGFFLAAGGVVVNHIAMWDGRRWTALGRGMNQAVLALAVDDRGNLYAGGTFTKADGRPADYVAMWDGSRWSPLGGGVNSTVYALAFSSDGTLYSGGSFTVAGHDEANYVAAWRDGRWEALGTGVDHTVLALEVVDERSFYAAGGFTTAGGEPAHQVALWDGMGWNALGEGIHPPMDGRPVHEIVLHPDGVLYAGGNFEGAGDKPTPFIVRWNGQTWTSLGTGVDGGVHALAVGPDGALYAGGYFTRAGDVRARHVARWKDGRWSSLEEGTEGLVHALAVGSAGMLHVAGSFNRAGLTDAARLACWELRTSTRIDPFARPREDGIYAAGVHPNPFAGSARLTFSLDEPAAVTLSIFDAAGRRHATLHEGVRRAGRNELAIEAVGLAPGVYVYVLRAGSSVLRGTIVVAR